MKAETANKKPTEGTSLSQMGWQHPSLSLYEVLLKWTGNICGEETEYKEKHYVFAESRLEATALVPKDSFEVAELFKVNHLCFFKQIIQKPIER